MSYQLTKLQKLAKEFKSPKAICMCGHTGDGPGSAHLDTMNDGHGACIHRGCDCGQFSWKEWTPAFLAARTASEAKKPTKSMIDLAKLIVDMSHMEQPNVDISGEHALKLANLVIRVHGKKG